MGRIDSISISRNINQNKDAEDFPAAADVKSWIRNDFLECSFPCFCDIFPAEYCGFIDRSAPEDVKFSVPQLQLVNQRKGPRNV